MNAQRTLRSYGWLFLASGVAFVALDRAVLGLLGAAAALLPWSRPWLYSGPDFWFALAGSLMAILSYTAFLLAEDPDQPPLWNVLLLSKAVSTVLFAIFAATQANALYLVGSVVDGLILVHLAALRISHERKADPLACRLPRGLGPFHEAWFARVNDAKTGRALWVRHTLRRGLQGEEAACWAVFFDPARGKTTVRRWPAPFAAAPSGFASGRIRGEGQGVSWDLRWPRSGFAPVPVVPVWLQALGLSSSGYVSVVPAARFTGTAVLDGEEWPFADAWGSVGHVWGRGMGRGWRWAHCIFAGSGGEPAVFELLSAQGPLGLRLTAAYLWRGGEVLASDSALRLLTNRFIPDGEGLRFAAAFPGLRAEGFCAPALTAELAYDDPGGARLTCRNSKTGSMRLRLCKADGSAEELACPGAAAVESVEPA